METILNRRKSLSAVALEILKILEVLLGTGTASAIRKESGNTLSLATIHVYAKRLVVQGLLERREEEFEYAGETIRKIIYQLPKKGDSELNESLNRIGLKPK